MTEIRDKDGNLLLKVTNDMFPLNLDFIAQRGEKFYIVNYCNNKEKEFLKMNKREYPRRKIENAKV